MAASHLKVFLSLGSQKAFSLLSAMALSIALARLLGPSDYGTYVFISALIPLAALPLTGGLPQLLTREIAKHIHKQAAEHYLGVVRRSIKLNAIVTAFVVLTCTIGMTLTEAPSKSFLFFLALLCVPFFALEATHNGIIRGLHRVNLAELPKQVVQPLLMAASLIVLVALGTLTTATAISALIFASAGAALVSVLIYRAIQPSFPKSAVAAEGDDLLLKSLASFSAIALITSFNTQIGILVLGTLDQNTDAASLRIAERAGQVVAMPLAIINLMIAPRLVTAFQNGDSAKLQEIAKRAAIVSFGLTVPITLTLWLFGDWLIGVSFGEAYVKAALPAVITVAAGQTMGAFLGSVWPLLTMTGHEKRALGGLGISFTLNVLLCLWLAPAYGATGAAVATAVSLVTCKLLFSIEVKKLLSINSRVF